MSPKHASANDTRHTQAENTPHTTAICTPYWLDPCSAWSTAHLNNRDLRSAHKPYSTVQPSPQKSLFIELILCLPTGWTLSSVNPPLHKHRHK